MNNKTLAMALALSTLILPVVASARLSNETIRHEGIISILGATSIKLEQHAGRSITLNKGLMEVKTTKISMGFSILDPQLVLKQNGQTLLVDIPSDNYSDVETFTVLGKDSGLNYDLYLRKTTTNSAAVQTIKTEACTRQEFGTKCGLDFEGKYNCIAGMQDKVGFQNVRKTTVDITDTYKLTLGQKNIAKAEFISSQTRTEIKKSEELTICK